MLLQKKFLIVFFIFLISIASSFALEENSSSLQQKVNQINSFIDYVHLHKANNEGSLSYERDTLLDYKSYIGNEIYKLELDLNKLDRLLEFVDEQYQNDKYSTFINDSVKENEKFNIRLKDYTKLRVIILNDLILAKDTDINIEYALDYISQSRSDLRSEYKFTHSTALWKLENWTHAFKIISHNSTKIVLDFAVFIFSILLFVIFKRICSIDRFFFKNSKIKNKKNLYWSAIKFKFLYDLILGVIIYPLIVLPLAYIAMCYSLIDSDNFYSASISLQIIILYSSTIYILSAFARMLVGNSTKTYLLIYYALFGIAMHFFLASLMDFSSTSIQLTQFMGDSLVPGFTIIIYMLIPALILFFKLRREPLLNSYKPNMLVVDIVRYFLLMSMISCAIMMILGGYPNLGLSISFDLYQVLFWTTYVYVLNKLLILVLDLIFCRKSKIHILRRTAENIIGDIKRTGFRYWVKSFVIILSVALFIVLSLLSFNVLPQKLYDTWEVFFYEGETLLGVDILPLQSFLESLFMLVILFVTSKVVILFAEKKVYPYTNWDLGAKEATSSIIKYIFVITAIFLFIKSLGISNTTIAFIASGLSVGLGFAMQDLVKNFFAGLVMLIERPVKIGDWVNVENEIGVVKRISIRATEILTFNNNSLIVPNNVMITNVVSNETLDATSRLVLDINVSYKHDPQDVIDVCRNVIINDRRIFFTPPPEFILLALGDSAMTISIRGYCRRVDRFYILSDLRIRVLQALKDHNIQIQYTKIDIRVNDLGDDSDKLENNI